MMNKTLSKQIPLISECEKIVQIHKGYSTDEKYLIDMPGGKEKFLLRMFSMNQWESKKMEFSLLKKMRNYNVSCPKPIEIGQVSGKGYMLTSYIEGNDGEVEISSLTDKEQYELGLHAGEELQKMHQCAAPDHIASWYLRKTEKHKKYMDGYLICGIRVENDEKIMRFIDENIHLMKDRPNLFQHDDFHLGNLIVNDKKLVGVIDFDRYDWGDPIHEFLKIGIFSREISVPFSIGQIRAYFDGEDPDEEFWRLYSLYMAMCVFSTVIWTLNTIPEELNSMLAKVQTFLEDHDYFDSLQPKWFH